jgi:transcriptional regulator with XRE-family HTH domain
MKRMILRFADNLTRLMGLHRLRSKDAARLLKVDPAQMSHWLRGKRQPSAASLLKISDLFDISANRMANASFADLLASECADVARYERVEVRIRRGLTRLREVK